MTGYTPQRHGKPFPPNKQACCVWIRTCCCVAAAATCCCCCHGVDCIAALKGTDNRPAATNPWQQARHPSCRQSCRVVARDLHRARRNTQAAACQEAVGVCCCHHCCHCCCMVVAAQGGGGPQRGWACRTCAAAHRPCRSECWRTCTYAPRKTTKLLPSPHTIPVCAATQAPLTPHTHLWGLSPPAVLLPAASSRPQQPPKGHPAPQPQRMPPAQTHRQHAPISAATQRQHAGDAPE